MMSWFKRKKSSSSTEIPLGIRQDESTVSFDLHDPHHIAISGQSRSGKSSLLYSILAGLDQHDYINVRILDMTSIVASALNGNPMVKNYVTGVDNPEAYVDSLREILDLVNQRTVMLTEQKKDKFTTWDSSIPLEFLIIEELPSLVTMLADDDAVQGRKTADRLSPKFISQLRSILATSLKTGVVVILLAQRFDAQILTGAARANIAIKVCLRSEPDGVKMLFPEADKSMVDRIGNAKPGRGLISVPGYGSSFWFKSDFMSYHDFIDSMSH